MPQSAYETLRGRTPLKVKPMLTEFSGRLYPNGEFTVGILHAAVKPSEILPIPDRVTDEENPHAGLVETFGLDGAAWAVHDGSPLGLSNVPISATRSPKGLKGMTSNGRRMVRNGCYLLEQEFGKGRCGFATLTLPDLIFPDWAAVCHDWGKLVNNFIKRFKRKLTARGVKDYICYVTEYQVKRFEKTGRPYPHIHLCYPARPIRNYHWYITADEIRTIWAEVVQSRCLCRYDFGASVDCVVVKKSVAAYLAKYLSKGAGDIQRFVEAGLPLAALGHWWGLTGRLRKAIQKGTRSSPAIARYLWRQIPAITERGGTIWARCIYIDTHQAGPRCIGMCGCLSPDAHKEVRRMFACNGP